PTARPLPERPSKARPVEGGDERGGCPRPVREPEAIAAGGEGGRVGQGAVPETRRGVDDRLHVQPALDLPEPGRRPRDQRRRSQAAGRLEVEHGAQVAATGPGDRDEVISLDNGT